MSNSLDKLRWNADGLLPVIIQDYQSGKVLMLAWMNSMALERTLADNRVTFWSRSRQKLWQKGEESGHTQLVKQICIDCDQDTLLIKVEQVGGIACHTGHQSCFFNHWQDKTWQEFEPLIKSSSEIYKS